MRDVEAGVLHAGEHRLRRRRGGGEELDHMRQRLLLGGGRIEQRRHHDRRATEMRHLVVAMASYIAGARTCRRQTCVPATTESDQVKHQPLQWNIGSVQR